MARKDAKFEAGIELFIENEEQIRKQIQEIVVTLGKGGKVKLADPRLARELEKQTKQFLKQEEATVRLKKKMQAYAEQVELAGKKGRRTFKGQTLASINLLRIIQDMEFGMFGMANNIQAAGESFSFLKRQGATTKEVVKGMFLPLVKGPLAFATVITLSTVLIRNWDKLIARAKEYAEVLFGDATLAQIKFNRAIDKAFKPLTDQRRKNQPTDVLLESVRTLNEEPVTFFDRLKASFREVESEVSEGRASRILAPFRIFFGAFGQEAEIEKDAEAAAQLAADAVGDVSDLAVDLLDERINIRKAQLAVARAEKKEEKESAQLLLEQRQKELEIAKIQKRQGFLTKFMTELNSEQKVLAQQRLFLLSQELKVLTAQRDAILAARQKFPTPEEFKLIPRGFEVFDERFLREQAEEAADELIDKFIDRFKNRQRALREASRFAVFKGRQAGFGEATPFRQRAKQLEAERRNIQRTLDDFGDQEGTAAFERLKARLAKINQDIVENQKAATQSILGAWSGMAGDLGNVMGDLGTILGKSAEGGFDEMKGFLHAQAVANAISSGIGVYQSYASSPLPPVLKEATAAAAMAAVISSLIAQARKIKTGDDSAGSSSRTGRFTQLNANVAARRAAAFEDRRRRRLDATRQQLAVGNSQVVEAVTQLGDQIKDQRIVYDDMTAADIFRRGINREQKTERGR